MKANNQTVNMLI